MPSDRLAAIVRDFPTTYTETEADDDGEEREVEKPRYGVVVIDLGGHPEEVTQVIRERVGRMRVLSPTAANVGIVVFSFAKQVVLDEIAEALGGGLVDYWRPFTEEPDRAMRSWAPGTEAQLIIADCPADASPWRRVLEDGCPWYEVGAA